MGNKLLSNIIYLLIYSNFKGEWGGMVVREVIHLQRGPQDQLRPGPAISLAVGSFLTEGVSNANEEAFLSGEMS